MQSKKKAALSVQTIFFILMIIIFIGLLVFGFQKIFDIQEEIPQNERIILKDSLYNALEFCNIPVNKGSSKKIEFTSSSFNSVCLISEDIPDEFIFLSSVSNAGDNVVLLDMNYDETLGSYNDIEALFNPLIKDSFFFDGEIKETRCYYGKIIISC